MNDTIYSNNNINDNTEIITIFLHIEVPRPRPVPQALRAAAEDIGHWPLLAIKIWGYQWIQLINDEHQNGSQMDDHSPNMIQ